MKEGNDQASGGRNGGGYMKGAGGHLVPSSVYMCVCTPLSVHVCVCMCVFHVKPLFSLSHLQSNNACVLLPGWNIFTTLNWWLAELRLLNGKIRPPGKWQLVLQLNFQIHLSICSWWVVSPGAPAVNSLHYSKDSLKLKNHILGFGVSVGLSHQKDYIKVPMAEILFISFT